MNNVTKLQIEALFANERSKPSGTLFAVVGQ